MSLVDRSMPHRLASPSRWSGLSPSRRLVFAVALLFTITSLATFAVPSRIFAWDPDTFSSTSEAQLVTLTNRARANAGLRALKVNSTLTSVARWRSKDMITRDYFSHDIPGYGKVWDKLAAIHYCYNLGGENIGWNNYPDDLATAAIQSAFMASPEPQGEHPGQGLGRHRHRRLQGRGRPKDVDGPVRRQVRVDDDRHPQADPQADPEADAPRRPRSAGPRDATTDSHAPRDDPKAAATTARRPSRPRDRRRRRHPTLASTGPVTPDDGIVGTVDPSQPPTDLATVPTPTPNPSATPPGGIGSTDGSRRHARRRSRHERRSARRHRRRCRRLLLRRLTHGHRDPFTTLPPGP